MIELGYWLKHSVLYAIIICTIGLTKGASMGAENDTPSNARLTSWDLDRDINRLNRMRYSRDVRQTLRCPPCEHIHCYPRRASKLNCRGGVTLGVCNCCPRCAKLEGEPCGGKWDYLGLCDSGMECVPSSQLTDIPGQDQSVEVTNGICRRVPQDRQSSAPVISTPEQDLCQPKCTPEFCEENPKDICSAVDNAEEKMSCGGECQHTSCLACQFLIPDQDCGSCPADDMSCLKQFGKCIKQQVCSKKKFPCAFKELDLQSFEYKFQCIVPQCSDRSLS